METVIALAQRTPIGSFQGQLGSFSAPDLGAEVLKSLLKQGVPSDSIDECFMGQVLQAGAGQAPARQVALKAGLSESTTCTTVNKVCGSGLQAVLLGWQAIAQGAAKMVVAGGMESMTQAPYMMPRGGWRMGHGEVKDSLMHDGLWDVYTAQLMGHCGELCASEKSYTREQQDEWAIESYRRAQVAQESVQGEIVPIEVQVKKDVQVVTKDEEPGRVQWEKIPKLRPIFSKEGTITAANASKISDGAAVLLLTTQEVCQKQGWEPLARLVAGASYAQKPEWFTTAPIGAIQKVLDVTQWKAQEVDLWEINEAFAVVPMAACDHFKLDSKQVNVNGGAIALGHPLGCSGARILITLLYAIKQRREGSSFAWYCKPLYWWWRGHCIGCGAGVMTTKKAKPSTKPTKKVTKAKSSAVSRKKITKLKAKKVASQKPASVKKVTTKTASQKKQAVQKANVKDAKKALGQKKAKVTTAQKTKVKSTTPKVPSPVKEVRAEGVVLEEVQADDVKASLTKKKSEKRKKTQKKRGGDKSSQEARGESQSFQLKELTKGGEAEFELIEDVILTDAEGRRLCKVRECDQLAVVGPHCRMHYLLLWKAIALKETLLEGENLQQFVRGFLEIYPDKYVEMVRRDLQSEKKFLCCFAGAWY